MKLATRTLLLGFSCLALSACGDLSSASFDYETASVEEREVWLEKQAKPIAAGIRHSLPNGRGPAPKMELDDVRVSARTRTVTFQIGIKGRSQMVGNVAMMQKQMMRETCPYFVKTPLYKADVSVRHTMYDQMGNKVMSVKVSPNSCDRALEKKVAAAS